MTGLITGAEPFDFAPESASAEDASNHAVLFLHGWTSSPRELRFLAQRVAEAGFHSRGILLPGHGRTVEALRNFRFSNHLAAAEKAFDDLKRHHARVSVCGLSLGGLLALYLARKYPVANLILFAPFLIPGGRTWGLPNRWVTRVLPSADRMMPKTGEGPIFDAEANAAHIAYAAMPVEGIVDNCRAAREIRPSLSGITCPTVVFQSPHDPTSDFSGAALLLRELGSEDKRLIVSPNGKHVITLDYDREMLERETLAWLSGRRNSPSKTAEADSPEDSP